MKSDSQEEFSTLIGEIYDASLSTDSWPVLLKRLSETLARAGVSLFVRDLEAEEISPQQVENMDPALVEEERKYHLTIKVNASQPAPRGAGASPGSEQAGASLDKISGDDGQPLAPPESIVLGCFISRDKPMGSLVGIQVSGKRDPAVEWDAATLRRLAPHLRRGFELHKQFLTLNVQGAATRRVLDHLPIGVILVDANARVLSMNACAEEIVNQRDGIAADRNGVRTTSGEDTATLRTLIAEAAASGEAGKSDTVGAMTVARTSMRRSFWVLVTGLRGRLAREMGSPAVVALFISDPERRHEIPAEALERFFGLTPAEIRLLEALVNGMSLEDASAEFKLSKNTLRTQLHQIFRKTETSRQSEVIKLVLSAPVQLSASEDTAE